MLQVFLISKLFLRLLTFVGSSLEILVLSVYVVGDVKKKVSDDFFCFV